MYLFKNNNISAGIIMNNTSLPLLLDEMNRIFEVKYLLTYRLNQDILENFFGVIRAKGGLHDHPDALQFRYRLRSYILGRNEGGFSSCANVEVDDTADLPLQDNFTGNILSKIHVENEIIEDDYNIELNEIQHDGLENLAGYICHKIKEKSPSPSGHYTWIDHLSEGGLSKPSQELLSKLTDLEIIFHNFNSDNINICKGYL